MVFVDDNWTWRKNVVNVIPIEANKFYSKYSDISIPSNRAVRHNIFSP